MAVPVISIIGTGNMGNSLISGLINHAHPKEKIWATDVDENKLAQIESTFHIHTTTDNLKAVQHADIVILAIKPQLFAEILPTLSNVLRERGPLVISIAAGIRTASMVHWLGYPAPIVRAMPNTPALINCGITALYANSEVTEEQRCKAESILNAVGMTVWLTDEKYMDVVTALSGSGPAYFFLMMEAMQNAAVSMGLSPQTATQLTVQTALGAARMAVESGKTLSELRLNVTSKGGTTEKAISVLEENNIRELFEKALQAAKRRSEELAETMSP